MDPNGSGIQYPTIDIDGVVFEIKWTRESSYDLSLAGINIAGPSVPFHMVVQALHSLIGYPGTARQLSTHLIGRSQEAYNKILEASGKVLPSGKKAAAATAKDPSPVQ